MSEPRVRVVLLCEDSQHEAFCRRFLAVEGWRKHEVLTVPYSVGRGAAEQWVREQYPAEVRALRSGHVRKALLVMLDADERTVSQREQELAQSLSSAGGTPRMPDEKIGHFIPRRNIETWIAYLAGDDVDEAGKKPYPKLPRERDCAPMVRALKAMCDDRRLREPAPESLMLACEEYDKRIK
jgi:hypothetical protein